MFVLYSSLACLPFHCSRLHLRLANQQQFFSSAFVFSIPTVLHAHMMLLNGRHHVLNVFWPWEDVKHKQVRRICVRLRATTHACDTESVPSTTLEYGRDTVPMYELLPELYCFLRSVNWCPDKWPARRVYAQRTCNPDVCKINPWLRALKSKTYFCTHESSAFEPPLSSIHLLH